MMNKLLCLCAVMLLCVCVSSGQTLPDIISPAQYPIKGKQETAPDGSKQMNYYNDDFCDWYLIRQYGGTFLLRPGKNTVAVQRKGQDGLINPLGKYNVYRGKPCNEIDINFPYALPVKPGAKVSWTYDKRESKKTMLFSVAQGDTVYASRGGTVCRHSSPTSVLVYHKDKTFAVYMNMSECFVYPSEIILPGQPVGIAGNTKVSLSFFFLDGNMFASGKPITYPYAHFIPFFRTSEGNLRPEENIEYEAVMDDEIVCGDMSPAARKRYLKKKK